MSEKRINRRKNMVKAADKRANIILGLLEAGPMKMATLTEKLNCTAYQVYLALRSPVVGSKITMNVKRSKYRYHYCLVDPLTDKELLQWFLFGSRKPAVRITNG